MFIFGWLAITIFSQSNNLPDYQNIKLSCHWQFPLTQNNKILFVAILFSLAQFSAFPSPLMHLMYKCYLALLILFISTLQSRLVSKEKGAKSKENISKDQNIYSRYILSSSLASIVGNVERTNKVFFYYQFLLINKFTTQDYLKYEGNKETITSSKLVRGASDFTYTDIVRVIWRYYTGGNNIFTDECCPWEYKVSPLDTVAVSVCPKSLNELL